MAWAFRLRRESEQLRRPRLCRPQGWGRTSHEEEPRTSEVRTEHPPLCLKPRAMWHGAGWTACLWGRILGRGR